MRVSRAVRLLGAQVALGDARGLELVEAALRSTAGNVSHAALALGVAHRTLARWIAASGALRLAVREARQQARGAEKEE